MSTFNPAARFDASALDLAFALMRAHGVRSLPPGAAPGPWPALRRLAADWRDQRRRRAIAAATAGLGPRLLRDIGLDGFAAGRPQ